MLPNSTPSFDAMFSWEDNISFISGAICWESGVPTTSISSSSESEIGSTCMGEADGAGESDVVLGVPSTRMKEANGAGGRDVVIGSLGSASTCTGEADGAGERDVVSTFLGIDSRSHSVPEDSVNGVLWVSFRYSSSKVSEPDTTSATTDKLHFSVPDTIFCPRCDPISVSAATILF